MTKLAPKYLSSASKQTLREALAELRQLESDVSPQVVNQELGKALEAHDAVHVIFGCDISDDDEILAHAWMAFGSDLGFAGIHAMNENDEHRSFADEFAHGRRLLVIARNIPRIVRACLRTRSMTKRWPFNGYHAYLDCPLAELRAEFGIRPLPTANRTGKRGPHHPPVTITG